jgi:hypothetical protein
MELTDCEKSSRLVLGGSMLRSIFLFALLVGFAAGQEPPPFGTVIEQWNLPMSGPYAGAGITWVRDSGKFLLADQGYVNDAWVWRLDPADPLGSIEKVPWQTHLVGGDTTHVVPLGLAWDPDSNCLWASAGIEGLGLFCLLRYVWTGDTWVWGGAPGDSWEVGDANNGGGLECLWLAGLEKSSVDGRFFGTPVASGELNHVVMFDPYTKTNYGRVAHGDQISERGCALVPYDSNYILTCGWNRDTYCKRDSTGLLLDSVHAPVYGPADWSLHIPREIRPDDTVCAFCINSNQYNTLQRVSLGMLWWQLGAVGVEEWTRMRDEGGGMNQTICRGVLMLPRDRGPETGDGQSGDRPSCGGTVPVLLDIAGRVVMTLQPGANDVRHVAPGVYYIRIKAGDCLAGRKLVKLE